jgi:hypothetical protein
VVPYEIEIKTKESNELIKGVSKSLVYSFDDSV